MFQEFSYRCLNYCLNTDFNSVVITNIQLLRHAAHLDSIPSDFNKNLKIKKIGNK